MLVPVGAEGPWFESKKGSPEAERDAVMYPFLVFWMVPTPSCTILVEFITHAF